MAEDFFASATVLNFQVRQDFTLVRLDQQHALLTLADSVKLPPLAEVDSLEVEAVVEAGQAGLHYLPSVNNRLSSAASTGFTNGGLYELVDDATSRIIANFAVLDNFLIAASRFNAELWFGSDS